MKASKLQTSNLRATSNRKSQTTSDQNLSLGFGASLKFNVWSLKPRRRSAFTLIELVISASLMAMILTAAYLCLNAAIAGQKLIEPRAEVIQNARVIMAMLGADLRSACPLSKD